MKKINLVFSIIATMLAFPAMADVYMGTGADPTWTPLYPTSLSAPPVSASASPGSTTVMPTSSQTYPTASVVQPTQFTGTYSPSASSFSSTNYAGTAPPPQPSFTSYGQVPCQSQQVDMIYGKGPLMPTPCPSAASVLGSRPVTYHIRTGSLKDNVQRMVNQSGWGQMVWNVPNDYRWVGDISITATSIQGALNQLLGPYPVQAVFYDTNRIVDIEPRRQA